MKQATETQAHQTLDTDSGVEAGTIDWSFVRQPWSLANRIYWALTGDETTHKMMAERNLPICRGPDDPQIDELMKELRMLSLADARRPADKVVRASQLLKALLVWRDNQTAAQSSGQQDNILVKMALNSDRRAVEASLREFFVDDVAFRRPAPTSDRG